MVPAFMRKGVEIIRDGEPGDACRFAELPEDTPADAAHPPFQSRIKTPLPDCHTERALELPNLFG